MSAFDHVIVRAVIDGETYWLDGARFGDRSLDALMETDFRWALPVRSGGADLQPVRPSLLRDPQVEINLSIDARSGLYAPADVKGLMKLRGDRATALRAGYESVQADERDSVLAALWSGYDWIEDATHVIQFPENAAEAVIEIRGNAKLGAFHAKAREAVRFQVRTARIGWPNTIERENEHSAIPVANQFPTHVLIKTLVRMPAEVGYWIDGEPVAQDIGVWRLRRTTNIAHSEAEFEVRMQGLASEISAEDFRAASKLIAALYEKPVYLQSSRAYVPTEKDLHVLGATRDNKETRFQQALALMRRGKSEEAIKGFSLLLEEDPKDAWSLANRGFAYLDLDKQDAATADFEAALALNPAVHIAYGGRGDVLMARDDLPGAIAAFSTALQIDPSYTYALQRRAWAHHTGKNYAGAVEDLRALTKFAPKDLQLNGALAFELILLGRPEEAMTVTAMPLEGAETGSDQWEQALMNRSRIALLANNYDQALKDADALVTAGSAKVLMLGHRCYLRAAANINIEGAKRDCDEALAIDRTYTESYEYRGLEQIPI